MSRNGDSDESWQTTYFLVFLFGSLIAVVASLASVVFGDSEPAGALGIMTAVVGLTSLLLLMVSLSHNSCLGALLAIGFGGAVFLLATLAALESEDSWSWYAPPSLAQSHGTADVLSSSRSDAHRSGVAWCVLAREGSAPTRDVRSARG